MDSTSGTTGKFLVSSPKMDDDVFRKTVVLVLGHDDRGAMGVIVNRITTTFNLEDLCRGLDMPVPENLPKRQLHFGGPVSLSTGIVLHSAGYQNKATISITDQYRVTSCADVLRDFQKGMGPRESLFVLGYAAWGPGQLESELRNGDWILSDPTEEMLFGNEQSFLWSRALKRSGFGRFVHMPVVGNA